MGRWLRGLLVGLFGWGLAGAAALADGLPSTSAAQPALWAVRDSDSTLYLFGTLHVRRSGAFWGGPAARQALAESATVWLEMAPEELAPERMRQLLQARGFDRDRPLTARLDAGRRRQLENAARAIAVPPPVLETMKPWLLAMVLTAVPIQQAGYVAENGVDRMVAQAAKDAGKPVLGLETAEQQLGYFDGLPEATQMAMLYQTLDGQDESVDLLRSAEAAWERGDVGELRALMMAPMAESYPDLHEAIIARRNRDWAERLGTLLAGSGVDFVAVGAGHLGDAGGLDALLRERGFVVERLTPLPP